MDEKKEHIRAARDWLGRAEDALSKRDDVEGDLKLILAKAELEHASPSARTRRLGSRLSRAAAFAAAACIACLVVFFVRGGEEPASAPAPKVAQEAAPAVSQTAALEESAAPAAPAAAAVQEAPAVPAAAPRAEAAPPAPERTEPPMSEPAAPAPETSPVPSPEMQKLMQSAGEVLRK